jgi:hypothetical protein
LEGFDVARFELAQAIPIGNFNPRRISQALDGPDHFKRRFGTHLAYYQPFQSRGE